MENINVRTSKRDELVDITGVVQRAVSKSKVKDGLCIVFVPHTTAGITINENADPSVTHDILLTMAELMPHRRAGYRHFEGNSDSHCKSTLFGCSEQVLITDGSLNLGTWQAVYFCEFDGPRNRKVILQIRGE